MAEHTTPTIEAIQPVHSHEDEDDVDDIEDDLENEELLNQIKSLNISDNYSDKVDKEDLRKLFLANKIRTDIVDIIFSTIDSNHDSFITVNEYISWKNELDIASLLHLIQVHVYCARIQNIIFITNCT